MHGTVSRDFLLLVFFINQSPPSPKVSQIRGDIRRSNRWQMKKIFNQKNFNNLLGHLWIVVVTYIYIFAFKFTKFAAGVVDTGGKFANGVADTGGQP
jgi:hypothetical protein